MHLLRTSRQLEVRDAVSVDVSASSAACICSSDRERHPNPSLEGLLPRLVRAPGPKGRASCNTDVERVRGNGHNELKQSLLRMMKQERPKPALLPPFDGGRAAPAYTGRSLRPDPCYFIPFTGP